MNKEKRRTKEGGGEKEKWEGADKSWKEKRRERRGRGQQEERKTRGGRRRGRKNGKDEK